MKLRNYFYYTENGKTFICRKDNSVYKSTYSVCLFLPTEKPLKATLPNRKSALKELKRLLTVYTSLTKGEINNL